MASSKSSRGTQQQQQQQQKEEETAAFANHAAQDAALLKQNDLPQTKIGLTTIGRVVLFLLFPLAVGTVGLYVGYLRSLYDSSKKIDFDNDFVYPFLLALMIVLLVGFQTGGFTSTKPKPLVAWPKVRRRKKVIHKRVIVDDDDDVGEDDTMVQKQD